MKSIGNGADLRTRPASPDQARRSARASVIGTTIEWYDFNVYGLAAALVFGPQFFPATSQLASNLAALGTFSIGFFARPLGGILAGHFGDRHGRKNVLIISLVLMGIGTVGIGLLPNYEAIGVGAPILLVVLRLIQGLGLGAEWGSAVLMSAEHAPEGRRGLFGSMPQLGNPAGIFLSTVAFLLTTLLLGGEAFAAWGWRIPFLVGGLLIVVGFVLRRSLEETPEFVGALSQRRVSRRPLADMLREAPGRLVLASLLSIAGPTVGYLLYVYLVGYTRDTLHIPSTTILVIVASTSLLNLIAIQVGARWSDRIGPKRVCLIGTCATAVVTGPFFLLLNTGSVPLVALAYCLISVAGIQLGGQATLLTSLFPTSYRLSGVSTAYQVGSILGGAASPLVAAALVGATGTIYVVAAYVFLILVVAIVATAMLRVEPADAASADVPVIPAAPPVPESG